MERRQGVNGADHFEHAAALMDESWEAHGKEREELVAAAQVHATLAQAAATAALLTVNPAYADYAQTVAWSQALKSS